MLTDFGVVQQIWGVNVLAGQTVETLNGHFCFGTLQVGFIISSIMALHGFPKWDLVVLPVPAKVVTKTISHWGWGGKEITQTIQAQQVGIVKETMIASNNPIWPVQRSALGG